jgi:hypothetical protein
VIELPLEEPRRWSPRTPRRFHLAIPNTCSRTCVDRVGSLEASRGRPRYPGPFRLSRITAPAGSMVRGGVS